MPTPQDDLRTGEIITITGETSAYKILHINHTRNGTHITATSLHAHPRIDITIDATRAHHAHKEYQTR